MKIEYIYELLDYYELTNNLEIDESESDSLILYNKDEYYDLDEFLSENNFSYKILDESYDYIIIKFYLDESDELISISDLLKYKSEIKNYLLLLENDSDYYKCFNRIDEYENELGSNKLNDIIMKFHNNHKNFYSFNLDESFSDAYELFSELLDASELKKYYEIFENLDELYDEYSSDELYNKFYNYEINISDESNIIIDSGIRHEITNINEYHYKRLLDSVIRNNFFYHDEINIEYINEFIELLNCFNEYNAYEILENNESNLKYIHNKLGINFDSFLKYSNKDEYILLKYNKSNENESINSYNDLIKYSDEFLSEIIDASEYYEYDSYEFHEFIRILKILI